MTRPAPYLFRYPRSKNWYLRLQIPTELRALGEPAEIRKSLGTHDRRLAEMKAAEEIQAHRKRLWVSQNLRQGQWTVSPPSYRWPLGEHVLEDGTTQIATETMVYLIRPGQPLAGC
ncbi:hypothetical protein DA075_04565 [Methylobacterium currus]|uniref:DUF6538 domain-containing protein n=1 Tax=Methylobacterium currus TaxID=2051553 RepID=A0A2R4WFI0_9HYPH|nr:hypothetical protein DA075_04565 [Methylobacterium currus]